jgi:uncharacterized protein involved in exopolysaccharide biosynthesis
MSHEMDPQDGPEFSLKDYFDILRRRRGVFAQVFVVVLAAGLAMSAKGAPPVYRTQARLLAPTGSSMLEVVDYSSPITPILRQAQPDTLETQVQVLQSGPFQERARTRAGIKAKPGVPEPVVSVQPVASTNIVAIQVEGGDAKDVAKLANTYVELYEQDMEERDNHAVRNAIVFLEKEQGKARVELETVQTQLVDFRKKHRLEDLSAERQTRTRQYVDDQALVRTLEQNISSTEHEVEDLQAQLKKEPGLLSETQVRDNPQAAALQGRLDALKAEREELLVDWTEGSERVQAINGRIEALEKKLAATPAERKVSSRTPNPSVALLKRQLSERQADLRRFQLDLNAARSRVGTSKQGLQQLDDSRPYELEEGKLIQAGGREADPAARHGAGDAEPPLGATPRPADAEHGGRLLHPRHRERAGPNRPAATEPERGPGARHRRSTDVGPPPRLPAGRARRSDQRAGRPGPADLAAFAGARSDDGVGAGAQPGAAAGELDDRRVVSRAALQHPFCGRGCADPPDPDHQSLQERR